MIFRELSNAVFRFVLRCAGAEIDGGVQIPPIRWWKIQRPIRARVNASKTELIVCGDRRQLNRIENSPSVTFMDERLKCSDRVKNLGVMMDVVTVVRLPNCLSV